MSFCQNAFELKIFARFHIVAVSFQLLSELYVDSTCTLKNDLLCSSFPAFLWQQLSWAKTPDSVARNLRRLPRKLSELCKSFSLSANLFRAPAPLRSRIKKREDIENKKGLSECISPHSKLIPDLILRQPKGKYAPEATKAKMAIQWAP